MLDTISVNCEWPLRAEWRSRPQLYRTISIGAGAKVSLNEKRDAISKAECSLPKLFFGHNGHVIENQNNIDEALEAFKERLNRICEVTPVTEWRPSRVDMAWNYRLPARAYILAHSSLRIPGCRFPPNLLHGFKELSWRSSKSKFVVTFYDKARQMRLKGDVLRVEVRLCGRELDRRFKGQDWRNMVALWHAYKGVMDAIPQIYKPCRSDTILDAIGKVGCLEPDKILRIEAFLAHLPDRTFYRQQKKIRSAAAQVSESFSWADYLSSDGPPMPVNLEPKARSRSPNERGTFS